MKSELMNLEEWVAGAEGEKGYREMKGLLGPPGEGVARMKFVDFAMKMKRLQNIINPEEPYDNS